MGAPTPHDRHGLHEASFRLRHPWKLQPPDRFHQTWRVQQGESPWTWCQSPDNLDANGAVTLDLMKCKRGRPSDLTELQAVWLYLNEGSFRVDNVRAE